ncbi:MAG: C40 family peptidase [Sphingobacteriales bacterium]|jgi:hypothetical protein|nr:C40 family peptidase [Sphingobacteriales bacterium]MBP9142600.1 C40 family peptidase [Chitinophagales bacterium]MDA0199505.1 C40 family peptidase [Bacteroidota bacterium]MBK7526526.1 C40 family peptidase [Sphingobacteriales bacterium]MBK8679902.1 C40 family peptidase [Sphingobacteriales bacterium]
MFAQIPLPAVPCRAAPSDRAEMTNQLLFGELVQITDIAPKNDWLQIQSLHDQYEAWIDAKQLAFFPDPDPDTNPDFIKTQSVLNLTHYSSKPFSILQTGLNTKRQQQKIYLPIGSVLNWAKENPKHIYIAQKAMGFFEGDEFIAACNHNDNDNDNNDILTPAQLLPYALPLLGAPYLWGGRTPMGFDCSGLMQVLYRLANINLPRDAWQQAQTGQEIPLNEAQTGNLAFFSNTQGRIVHVGMVVGLKNADSTPKSTKHEVQILHAHGQVRLDALNERGIFNSEKQTYSHSLAFVCKI